MSGRDFCSTAGNHRLQAACKGGSFFLSFFILGKEKAKSDSVASLSRAAVRRWCGCLLARPAVFNVETKTGMEDLTNSSVIVPVLVGWSVQLGSVQHYIMTSYQDTSHAEQV